MSSSWLQLHLVTVLKTRLPVLQRWRSQANLQGQIKNLENWILVELTHQLLDSGAARVVLTNGFFANGQDVLAPKRVASKDVPDLHGRKSKAIYLSADLSVRPNTGTSDDDEYWIAELKTGIAGMELLDDLRLVRFYCGAAGLATRTRSELAWVVISPKPEAQCRAVKKRSTRSAGV